MNLKAVSAPPKAKMMSEYLGEKTTTTYYKSFTRKVKNKKRWQFWKPYVEQEYHKEYTDTYYEKAYDSNGTGLLCGDWVKVISVENNPPASLGQTYEVKGIFEGDLMLGESSFYCWPRNVIKESK